MCIRDSGYPTKSASYQKLGRFLMDEMKVSEAVKDQVLFFIYKECSMDGRMSAIMENLNQKGIQFNDEQLEKFTKLIMEANNNTRMLEFRGYTPNEISGAVWPVSYTHLDVYKRQIQNTVYSTGRTYLFFPMDRAAWCGERSHSGNWRYPLH